MQTTESPADRVKRGAEWLDRYRAGWADDVNVALLRLEDCYDCVLGQLFDAYGVGVMELASDVPASLMVSPDSLAYQHGFNADDATFAAARGGNASDELRASVTRYWDGLNDAWRAAIMIRRAS